MEQLVELIGIPIELQMNEFTLVEHLIYYDGPILSHFKNSDRDYLFYWVDVDKTYNRWFIIEVDIELINMYTSNKISLHNIIYNTPYVYSVDIDNDLNYNNIKSVFIENVPDEYFPTIDSYYEN